MSSGTNRGPAVQAGEQGFNWWMGRIVKVEDDPHSRQLGMAQVRIFNLHDGVPDDALPWAQVIMPVTSPGVKGEGDTPQLKKDSFVFGFFADAASSIRHAKVLFIVGTIPYFPGADTHDDSAHSLSLDARGKRSINKKKRKLPLEPEDPFKAQYTKNRVIRSESGHMIELDDTPGAERVHLYHKSGSYIEIQPDGTVVVKSVKDSVEVAAGVKNLYVKGSLTAQVGGSADIKADGNVKIIGKAGLQVATAGRLYLKGALGITLDSGTDIVAECPGGFASTVSGIRSVSHIKAGNGLNDVIICNGRSFVFTDGILTQSK